MPRPPLPCALLHCRSSLGVRTYVSLGYAPPFSVYAFFDIYAPVTLRALHACPTLPCDPPIVVRASHACPYPCAPLEHKFQKVVLHSTTWASGPLTTKRLLTAGCLGGDHSFYIHSYGHVHGCTCMHVKFHEIYLFIINACQTGCLIKLFASLYTI
jgi:hypothetical protein